MIRHSVLQTYIEVGTHACRTGHLTVAEKMFRAVVEEAHKEDSNHTRLAETFLQIAGAYAGQNEYKRSASFYRRALALYNYSLGPYNEYSAGVLESLAWIYHKQGKLGQAARFCARAVIAGERSPAPDKKRLARRAMTLAWLYIQQDKPGQADLAFRKSLEYQRAMSQAIAAQN